MHTSKFIRRERGGAVVRTPATRNGTNICVSQVPMCEILYTVGIIGDVPCTLLEHCRYRHGAEHSIT